MRANWVQSEIELLKLHYPNKTAKEMAEILPQYSINQINRKAKVLGIQKKPEVKVKSRLEASLEAREDLWTDEEKKIIIDWYPTEGAIGVQERLPNPRPVALIKKIAYRLGVKRNQKSKIWEVANVETIKGTSFSIKVSYKAK